MGGMNLAPIKPGDIVRIDKRGQKFIAIVTEKHKGEVVVVPELRHITYRTAKSREIKEHWKKAGRYYRKKAT